MHYLISTNVSYFVSKNCKYLSKQVKLLCSLIYIVTIVIHKYTFTAINIEFLSSIFYIPARFESKSDLAYTLTPL